MASELAIIANTIKAEEKNYASVLPAHVPAKRFVKTAIVAISNNPDLLKADKTSLYAAVAKASSDGLILDNREAALVIFKGIVQYMPMVAGIIKRARNSGEISTITAHVVCENDTYCYEMGDEEKIIHKLPAVGVDRGEAIAAYAIVKLKDGGIEREWATKEQIEKVRKISRSGNDENGKPKGIWKQWPEEMWCKTVLRRLLKRCPMSTDLDRLISDVDNDYDFKMNDSTEPVSVTPNDGETAASRAIKASVVEVEPVIEESDFI